MAKVKTPYHIIWRPIAEADLDNIIDYIAQDNPIRTDEFGQELREKILQLAQNPKVGRTGRPDLPAFMRELVVHRNYMVFYRLLDEACIVEILRVKHAAQRT